MENAKVELKQNNYEKSREFCIQALAIDSLFGEAYMLIGYAYINSADSCELLDPFTRKMILCLAVDMFEKAKQVDASQKEKAEQLIETSSKWFLTEKDIFTRFNEGDTIHIGCWINEKTTVRYNKH